MAELPDPLSPILRNEPPWDADAVEGALRAWTARTVDAAFDGSRPALEREFDTLRRSYRLMASYLSLEAEAHPEYFLGRVASLLEVAGEAHQRIRPEEWKTVLDDPVTRTIADLLRRAPLRPTDVARRMAWDLSTASKRLSALAEIRFVVPMRSGREVRYALSRSAEEMVLAYAQGIGAAQPLPNLDPRLPARRQAVPSLVARREAAFAGR